MEATFTKVGDEGGEEIELATIGLDDDGDERDGVALFAAAGGHKRSDGGGADALGAAREGGDGDGAAADEDDALAPLDEEGVRALLWSRSNCGFLLQYLAVSRGLGSRDSSRRVGRLLGKVEIGPRGSPPFVTPRESPPPAMLPRRCPHCCAHTAAQTAAQTAAHTAAHRSGSSTVGSTRCSTACSAATSTSRGACVLAESCAREAYGARVCLRVCASESLLTPPAVGVVL